MRKGGSVLKRRRHTTWWVAKPGQRGNQTQNAKKLGKSERGGDGLGSLENSNLGPQKGGNVKKW